MQETLTKFIEMYYKMPVKLQCVFCEPEDFLFRSLRKNFIELNFMGLSITDEDILTHIVPALKILSISNLEFWLNFNDNQIGEQGARALAQFLTTSSITFLSLSNNPINDRGVEFLACASKDNKCLKSLELRTIATVQQDTIETILDVLAKRSLNQALPKLKVSLNAGPKGKYYQDQLKNLQERAIAVLEIEKLTEEAQAKRLLEIEERLMSWERESELVWVPCYSIGQLKEIIVEHQLKKLKSGVLEQEKDVADEATKCIEGLIQSHLHTLETKDIAELERAFTNYYLPWEAETPYNLPWEAETTVFQDDIFQRVERCKAALNPKPDAPDTNKKTSSTRMS